MVVTTAVRCVLEHESYFMKLWPVQLCLETARNALSRILIAVEKLVSLVCITYFIEVLLADKTLLSSASLEHTWALKSVDTFVKILRTVLYSSSSEDELLLPSNLNVKVVCL